MRAHRDGAVLSATDGDLNELIGSVGAEANHESNWCRQQRLDAAFDAAATRLRLTDGLVMSSGGAPDGCPSMPCREVRFEGEVAARHLTVVERRAPWREDLGPKWISFPIARLRYTAADELWTSYWRDRNPCFHLYDVLAPARRVDDLLAEIDRDPTCTFWG